MRANNSFTKRSVKSLLSQHSKNNRLILLFSSLGLLLFLVATFSLPFNQGLFSKLFTKPYSHAANTLPTFGLGVSVGEGDTWAPNSGIPWSYTYQYITQGWENWNSNGTFANNYASEKASHGYIPVLTYYALCSCSNTQTEIADINNVTDMQNYLNNFILLMKRLGPGNYDGIQGFGGLAIVHVEPDFMGGMTAAVLSGNCTVNGTNYCTSAGDSPALMKAVVASTGITEVSGKDPSGNPLYPDTLQGLNWALLHIRDLYAPNVKLALHLSNWATGDDIGSDTTSSVQQAQNLGNEAGQFLALSGATTTAPNTSTYDLVFNDVLDRDAGWYEKNGNDAYWWDRLDTSFPNFKRWEAYVGAAHTATTKPFIIWQIPLGNQYFDSENDTNNHFQDNKVEYFLGQNLDPATSHLTDLQNIGVIGLMFGAGASSQSNYTDQAPDGVTNPMPFCDTDGMSSGQNCNNHLSVYPDDDGGYLRLMAAKFYNVAPPPTPAPTPLPTPTPTLPPPATTALPIYDNMQGILINWGDCSYTASSGESTTYNNTSPTLNNAPFSIKTVVPAYNAFSICPNPEFADGAYAGLDFWIQAGAAGVSFNVQATTDISGIGGVQVGASNYITGGDTTFIPGKWEHVIIPLSALGVTNQKINRLWFIGAGSSTPPPAYFGSLQFIPQSLMPPPPAPSNLVLYSDVSGSLGGGAAECSWTTPVPNYSNTSPVLNGSFSISANLSPFTAMSWCGNLNTTGYGSFDFWVQAATSGLDFQVLADTPNGQMSADAASSIVSGDTSFVPGKWEHVVIPFSKMGLCNTTISRLYFDGGSTNPPAPSVSQFYFDTVQWTLDSNNTACPAPTPAPTPPPGSDICPIGVGDGDKDETCPYQVWPPTSPTPSPSATSSIVPTPTPSASPTPTPSPTSTPKPTASPSACPAKTGDFNNDGSVNLTDLSIFASSYGTSSPNIPNPCTDLNQDGSVNLTDLSLFAAVYGT